ncbi:MAG TPA: SRPBCC family protein [Kiritimatiellia bacterium]|nr:SRPBCC family protein [Kiritimatiellia bacterium]
MKSACEVRHISVSINRTPDEVYEFVFNPVNLPRWATGLGGSIRKEGDVWVADSPMGRVEIFFVEKNDFGVLDHYVTPESGVTVYNPMRVMANHGGSEVVFSLIRQPEMTNEAFARDAAWVEKDLGILKALLEKHEQ